MLTKLNLSERPVWIIALVVTLLILSFSIRSCNQNKNNAIIANLKLNRDSISFTTKIDKLGNDYIVQEQTIATQDKAIRAGLISEAELKAKNIKDVNSIVRLNLQISVLKDTILKYKNDTNSVITIIDTVSHDTTDYLKLPNSVSTADKYIKFKGSILKTGFRIDLLELENNETIIIGNTRSWFLGKKTPVVTIENDNPYFKAVKMSNVIIKNETPWYQKNLTWFIIGGGLATFIFTR